MRSLCTPLLDLCISKLGSSFSTLDSSDYLSEWTMKIFFPTVVWDKTINKTGAQKKSPPMIGPEFWRWDCRKTSKLALRINQMRQALYLYQTFATVNHVLSKMMTYDIWHWIWISLSWFYVTLNLRFDEVFSQLKELKLTLTKIFLKMWVRVKTIWNFTIPSCKLVGNLHFS